MDPRSSYSGFFRKQCGSSYSEEEVLKNERFLFSQYRLINILKPPREGEAILEIGSGLGGLYGLLGEPADYIGLEVDDEAMEFSNRHFNTDRFLHMPFEELDDSLRFDRVFALEVLEHFRDPVTAIDKIRRVLKEGGVFIGTTPYPFKKSIEGHYTHIYVLHPKSWEALFKRAGFSSVMLRPMSFIPFLWRLNKWMNPVLPVYIPFRWVLSTTLIIAEP
jgi:SAM-dependent methyltransferase